VIGTAEEGLPESLLFEREEGGDGDDEYRGEAAVQTAGPGYVVDCMGHLIRSGAAGGAGSAVGGGGDREGDEEEEEEGEGRAADGEEEEDDDDTR
jgi:hypothetical protein